MFKTVLGSIGIIAIALLVMFILIYNNLVRVKNLLNEAWDGVNNQLKRRYDLIPNLIATIKGHSDHESNILERVTQLRTIAISAHSINEKTIAENNLTNGLKSLLAVSEKYSILKASHNFSNLQTELSDIERQLKSTCKHYNNVTKDYNNAILIFPSNLIAKFLKYKQQSFFEINTI